MLYNDLQNIVVKKTYYEINNNSSKNIVLFGNCHMAVIGFYLNWLLKKKYNIYIVLSFLRNDIKRFESLEREKIYKLVQKSDCFIYQKHYNNFNINAANIHNYAKNIKILIPNIWLVYSNQEKLSKMDIKIVYSDSLKKCETSILESDFSNFIFVLKNCKNIRFFTIPSHPTNYLLYLLSLQIYYKLMGIKSEITLESYYSHKNDVIFRKTETVILPGFCPYDRKECELLGINYNSEFYDKNCYP